MVHWTDDPRLHGLMTHLGKTGKTGKPTRGAYVAGQVSKIMVKIEPMVANLSKVKKTRWTARRVGQDARLDRPQEEACRGNRDRV